MTDELCRATHEAARALPRVAYPFNLSDLPRDGIYFLFEAGEYDAHTGDDRIVHVGTHKNGNFRSRISEHYLLDKELNIMAHRPAPKDRSVLRKNLGRAWICKQDIEYLEVWNIDFTTRRERHEHAHRRDVVIEQEVEEKITTLLREGFSFAWVPVADQAERMGAGGLKGRLIGTLAQCSACAASTGWLGRHSPDERIRTSGLWQVQHLHHDPICDGDIDLLRRHAR